MLQAKHSMVFFYEIALQEVQIRKDPVARSTDILKKVFGR